MLCQGELQVFRYCGENTAERLPKAAVWTTALVQTPCIDPI